MDKYNALKTVLTAAGCTVDADFGDIVELDGRRCCLRELDFVAEEQLRERLIFLLSGVSPSEAHG